jgi:CheY-like chemotaxis protein
MLDLGLPELNGYRSFRAIDAATNCKVPVVILTADDRSVSRDLTVGFGASDSPFVGAGRHDDRCARERGLHQHHKKCSRNLAHPPSQRTRHSPNREPNSTGVRSRRNFVSICMFVFRPLPVVNTFIALGMGNGKSDSQASAKKRRSFPDLDVNQKVQGSSASGNIRWEESNSSCDERTGR